MVHILQVDHLLQKNVLVKYVIHPSQVIKKFTDPSYTGQIITTFHVGNVGSNKFDEEGNSKSVTGIVVRQHPTNASNWRSETSLKNG